MLKNNIVKNYIYIIQNLINLKIYVGQTIDPARRWAEHKSDVSNKDRKDYHLYRSMRYYAEKYKDRETFSFTVIEEYDTEEESNEAEKFFIQYFNSKSKLFGYNKTDGGKDRVFEAKGEDIGNASLTNAQAKEIRAKFATGKYTCVALSEEYKVGTAAGLLEIKHMLIYHMKYQKKLKGFFQEILKIQKLNKMNRKLVLK